MTAINHKVLPVWMEPGEGHSCICPHCGTICRTVNPTGTSAEIHCNECDNAYRIEFLGFVTKEGKGKTVLKPCPFCDSTEIHTYEPTAYEIGNDASVSCENPICGAEVRGDTLKEAIAKWNRRSRE